MHATLIGVDRRAHWLTALEGYCRIATLLTVRLRWASHSFANQLDAQLQACRYASAERLPCRAPALREKHFS